MIISAALVFFGLCIVTRYVSVASICLVIMFSIEYSIFAFNGRYSFNLDNNNSHNCMIESVIIILIMTIMGIYRHRANIVRLIHHEENKLGSKKA